MAVGQHTVRASKYIPVPIWTRPQADESIPVQKNGIVHRAGMYIIQCVIKPQLSAVIFGIVICETTARLVMITSSTSPA